MPHLNCHECGAQKTYLTACPDGRNLCTTCIPTVKVEKPDDYCNHCGEDDVILTFIDGKTLCNDCLDKETR